MVECGVHIAGVIDRRADEYRNAVCCPIYDSSILDTINEDIYILVTLTKPQSIHRVIDVLNDRFDYVVLSDGKTVQIDISGMCNLKCKSCPVGNSKEGVYTLENRGFMKPDMYERIIQKLKNDLPSVKCVFLYIYGDPFLSPYLPELIRITKRYHLLCILSTNLSMRVNLTEILKANPDCIKISVSGFSQNVYSKTHNNGNIELVKRNMQEIKSIIDEHHLNMGVLVGYHIYKNNKGEEMERMKKICDDLGFVFQSTKALFFNWFKRMGIEEYDKSDIEFITSYCENPEEILRPLKKKTDFKYQSVEVTE